MISDSLKGVAAGLQRLFERAPALVVLLSGPEHRFEFANAAYRELIGQHYIFGRPVAQVLPELAEQGFVALLDEVYESGKPFTAEGALTRLSRTREGPPEDRYFDFVYQPVFGDTGEVLGIFGQGAEVTARIAAESALRTSQATLDLATQASGLGIWELRLDAEVMEASPRAREIWSLPGRGAVTQSDVFGAIHPEDREAVKKQFERAIDPLVRDRSPYEYRVQGQDGVRWARAHAEAVFAKGPDGPSAVRCVGTLEDITTDRERVHALAASEARLRLAIDAGRMAVWEIDGEGNVKVSPELNRLLGLPEDARPTLDDLQERYYPGELERLQELGRVALEEGARHLEFEYRHLLPNDEVRWLGVRAELLRDASGLPAGSIGVVTDITERKRVEERVRESEQQLRLATEAAEIGLWDLDVETDTLFWPPRVKAMFGISPDTPISMADYYAGLHPDDAEHTSAAFADAVDPQKRAVYDVEYRTIGKQDGVCRWVAAKGRGIFDASGRCVRVIGTAIDVTEKKRTETELRELNERLEQRVTEALADRKLWADVFESAEAMIAALAPDHRFLALNKAYADEFERIFGVRPKRGDDLGELLASKPEHRAAALRIWNRALTGEEFVMVEDFGDPERDRPYYELRFNRLRDRDGSPMGAFQYAVDVSERLRAQARLAEAEEQLRQSQKLEAIGQLTGGVAHDFNNLLTVIRGSVELLRRPDVSEERRARYVGAIGETADRAAKLTGQLLAFARRQALRPEVFDPGASIQALTVVLRTLTGSRVTIETSLPDPACWVDADPGQFDTALINMAVNARDAMGAEGVLTILVAPVCEIPAIRGQAAVEGDFVAVSVTDTGEGIPADRLERVFEPFFTTKPVGHGTGLGLSQVYGFAKQSGGEVEVQSTPGEGATFILYLPRANAPARSAENDALEPRSDGQNACVLVVEDNREVGEFATQALAELGYRSVWAANGEAALAELHKDPARFDIVFSDVVMPGMNGVQLGQEIRRRYEQLPVLLASGYSHILAEQNDHGFELLQKPYSIEELSRVLRMVIGERLGSGRRSR